MNRHPSRWLMLFNLVYLIGLIAALAVQVVLGDLLPIILAALGIWFAGMIFLSLAPERSFEDYFIKSDLPVRPQQCLRLTFNTLMLTGIAVLTLWTGMPWWLYYLVLWVVPLGTSFAFFMILRQVVQHGNAGQGRFTNTRVFHIHWLLNWAIFPIGNDYHLPHHLCPMVPHYNLRKLHALLMQTEEYSRHATFVDGYFLPTPPQEHPTVLDLMARKKPVEVG